MVKYNTDTANQTTSSAKSRDTNLRIKDKHQPRESPVASSLSSLNVKRENRLDKSQKLWVRSVIFTEATNLTPYKLIHIKGTDFSFTFTTIFFTFQLLHYKTFFLLCWPLKILFTSSNLELPSTRAAGCGNIFLLPRMTFLSIVNFSGAEMNIFTHRPSQSSLKLARWLSYQKQKLQQKISRVWQWQRCFINLPKLEVNKNLPEKQEDSESTSLLHYTSSH